MLSSRQLGVTVIVTVVGLTAAYLLHVPSALGFILGLLTLIQYAWRSGIPVSALLQSMLTGIRHTKEVIWILALVGLIIPAWTACGTIPYMIDGGIGLIDPRYFVTFAFVLASVISMILGTSTGTLSSVGIPLMGLGGLLHIPLPLLAGALVSGVFVGDRTSPFSSAHQLTASSTGVKGKEQFVALLPTTIAALVVSFVFFLLQDLRGSWHAVSTSAYEPQFRGEFSYSLWLLLPVGVFLGANLLRLRTKYGFLLSIAAALAVGTVLQGHGWKAWGLYLWQGYHSSGLETLQTKGLAGMIELIVLIVLAGAFNGILEANQVLQPYMQKLLGSTSSLFAATVRTSLFGLVLALISCTQTLPIMMTGRSLLPVWERRFPRSQLSRVVADTSLIFAPMIPWNLLGVVCGTILGVSVEGYLWYSPFLWALPVCTWVWSCVVIRK